MKLFYNEAGQVVGSLEGATPEIEAMFGLPSNAIGYMEPDRELYLRLVDPKDKLHPHDLKIINMKNKPKPTNP